MRKFPQRDPHSFVRLTALPTILSDATFAKQLNDGGGDWMPPGAEDAFKKLWGV